MPNTFDNQHPPLFTFMIKLLSDGTDFAVMNALLQLLQHADTKPVHLVKAATKLMRERPELFRLIPSIVTNDVIVGPVHGLSLLVFFGGRVRAIVAQLAAVLYAQDTLPEDSFITALAMVQRYAPPATIAFETAIYEAANAT